MSKVDLDRQYLISIDAGGTMTDCYLSDADGVGYLGKALTNPVDQATSYGESVADAAATADLTVKTVHEAARLITWAGTTLTNIVMERDGARVGMLTTRGFEHYPQMENALTYLGQSRTEQSNLQLHRHTDAMVAPEDVRGISERIIGGSPYDAPDDFDEGRIVIPLAESEVEVAAAELLDDGVEAIAICFLCSYTNPVHEQRAKEITQRLAEERGHQVPVVTSSDLCPRRGENARMKSTLLEAYGAERTRQQLFRVEGAAQELGAEKQDLTTLVSYGAVTNIRHPRLYETVVAGPIGGMLGGRALSELKGWSNVICCDLGGTSFDVGTIVGGLSTVESTMDFAGHRLNVPALQIDSIGSGAGSEVHVDKRFKRVTLGPKSAGSNVGTCYKHPTVSVADLDVILGYLPVENFLGGKIELNPENAERRIKEDLAEPLGMDMYEASWGVLALLHDLLGNHINGSLVSRGLNPGDYTVLAYGGSGPLHLWGLAERVEALGICTVPWAAAFSAWGVSVGESFYRLEQTVNSVIAPELSSQARVEEAEKIDEAWRVLEKQALAELVEIGVNADEVEFRYGISARYVGQLLASWSAHVPRGEVKSSADVDMLIESFEDEFGRSYPSAGKFPEAGYQFDGAFVEAVIPKVRPEIREYDLQDPEPAIAPKGERSAYWNGEWLDFVLWDMDSLGAGNVVVGPAIIEHSMTTMVVPPGKHARFDEHSLIWYEDAVA